MDSERGHGREVLGVRLARLGLGLQATRHVLALIEEDIGCLGLSLILRHRRDAVINVVPLPTVLVAGECCVASITQAAMVAGHGNEIVFVQLGADSSYSLVTNSEKSRSLIENSTRVGVQLLSGELDIGEVLQAYEHLRQCSQGQLLSGQLGLLGGQLGLLGGQLGLLGGQLVLLAVGQYQGFSRPGSPLWCRAQCTLAAAQEPSSACPPRGHA
uniref:Uncharacterized protein n=1 Tax=Pipistrellus kuhlii TaxID=59472 RepID=A0A7J7TQ80_PIPKU|nr:hypothetical protein mPipKuh1_009305 [Pipistrellus kuhlii]